MWKHVFVSTGFPSFLSNCPTLSTLFRFLPCQCLHHVTIFMSIIFWNVHFACPHTAMKDWWFHIYTLWGLLSKTSDFPWWERPRENKGFAYSSHVSQIRVWGHGKTSKGRNEEQRSSWGWTLSKKVLLYMLSYWSPRDTRDRFWIHWSIHVVTQTR